LRVIEKVKRKALAVAGNAMAKKTMNLLAAPILAKKQSTCASHKTAPQCRSCICRGGICTRVRCGSARHADGSTTA